MLCVAYKEGISSYRHSGRYRVERDRTWLPSKAVPLDCGYGLEKFNSTLGLPVLFKATIHKVWVLGQQHQHHLRTFSNAKSTDLILIWRRSRLVLGQALQKMLMHRQA